MKLLITFIIYVFFSTKCLSQNLNIIRDAETENLLKEISFILIDDNKLDIKNLNFYIDNKTLLMLLLYLAKKFLLLRNFY